MIRLFKDIHQHSLEVEDKLAEVPESVASAKAIERTFGIMGSVLVATGFAIVVTAGESEIQHTAQFVGTHEASVTDVAKMGLVDPLLLAGGGLLGYTGLEDIGLANGLRRRRINPDSTGAQHVSSGE